MALADLFKPILDAIKRAFAPFGRLFDLLSRFWTNLTNLWTDIGTLVESITAEITAWKNFKENVSFRTRVINVKKAIDKTEEFIAELSAAKTAVLDLWTQLKGKFETAGNPTEEASEAIKDIEKSGFRELLSKFPRLLKGVEKILGFVAVVADALE